MSLPRALEAIKRKTDDLYVLVLAEDTEIVFRIPPYKQVYQIVKMLSFAEETSFDTSLIYEHLFKLAVEDPWFTDDVNDIHAGIPETISRLVIYLSGLGQKSIEYTEALFEESRKDNESVISMMKRTICSVFSGYTFEEVERLNYPRIVGLFISAEKVLLDRGIIESVFKFENPEGNKKKAQESLWRQIEHDTMAYDLHNKPKIDPRFEAIRKQAIDRAKAEEQRYHKKVK